MRRIAFLALALSLLAACTGPERLDARNPPLDPTPGRPGEPPVGGNQDGSNQSSPSRPSTTRPPARPGSPGASRPVPTSDSNRPSDAAAPTPQTDGSAGPPGAFARTILRPEPATVIVFERYEQRGAAPRPSTVDHATSVLRAVSDKPVSQPASPVAVPGGAQDWTPDQIRQTADRLTREGQGGGRAVLHVLFLRGTMGGDETVLGSAVRGDVIALFSDSIAAAETPLVSRGAIEDAVVMHELGHLLGLVDLVRDTGRDDPEHPGHSRNRESVMYWAVESSVVTQVLSGGPPRDFDQQDLADLAVLRKGG